MYDHLRGAVTGKRVLGVALSPLIICLLTASYVAGGTELVFYVSTQGNDSWSGTLASPNPGGTDGPFATVARAQKAVRQAPERGEEPITVLIRGGVYQLSEPLTFTWEDSGSERAPVTYAAFPGEQPIFSGGSVIKGWQRGNDSIWTARIPEVASGEWYFHQLFLNETRQIRARTPNEGYLHIAGTLKPLVNRDRARGDPSYKIGFRYRADDLKPWKDLDDINIFLYHSWTCSLHWIDELDEENHTVRFTNPSAWPVGWWDPHERYHLENYLEALDSPGEWYLERKTGTLYLWPPDGQNPNEPEVVAPRLQHLLILQGDAAQGKTVHNVVLRGLSFRYADWKVDRTKMADGQAATFLSAAVVASGARNVSLENCEIAHVGEYAMILGEGCKYDRIIHCEIHDMGGGGIRIGQTHLPEEPEKQTDHITIDNCFIHDGGHVFRAGIGVWIGRSSYNVISHNEICDFYYSGCSVGWSWGYAPSSAHHNVLEYNHIHHLGKGVLSDMGGIYTLGVSPGTVERFNIIHDVYSYSYGGWGLYTDEGSSEIVLEGNIVYNTKSGSFHQHYGQENVLRNNILGPALDATVIRTRQEDHISFIFEHNIVLTSNGHVLGGAWSNGNYRIDYNLYWDTNGLLGEDMDFGGVNFDRWRAAGRDQHSVVADPLFVDAERHDYRLLNASPAFLLGFQATDTERVGLYGEESWVRAPEGIVRQALPEFVPPSLTRKGPASYPENLSDAPLWIIKYDPTGGRIPEASEACTLVWTIDARRYPSATPPGSVKINGSCESPMKVGLDGLWYLIIPKQEVGAISFRFRDGFTGSNWDDNDGKNWWITSPQYVSGLLGELESVILNGTEYGGDMSPYRSIYEGARSAWLAGDYATAMELIAEGLNPAWATYVERLLKVASERLESLKGMGAEVGLDERLLYLARLMIQEGKYSSSEGYCRKVLHDISNKETALPEAFAISPLLLLSFLSAARLTRNLGRATRRHAGPQGWGKMR